MPIVFVGSTPFGGGERLARSLADKLGYPFFSRDDVVERANQLGIPVGKLEVAMVRKPSVAERLSRLRAHYRALATATLCEASASGELVYYGRAGHLLLPGVSHVVRMRVVPDPEQRLESAMQRTKLPREKTERMLADIDGDIRAWVRAIHGVDFDDLSRYDMVVNLEHISLANAATALCGLVELPDFAPTPASRRAMADLCLQANAQLRLALDEQAAAADLTVRASSGVVTVTYVPGQAELAERIPGLLRDLADCREVRCTLASSTILWIEERFDPQAAAFAHVNELARRWGAAVELLAFEPGGASRLVSRVEAEIRPAAAGGVEDDVVESLTETERGLRATVDALVHEGRSGGAGRVSGDRDDLAGAIRSDVRYSLVTVGRVFLDKPAATRTRLTRELSGFLSSRLRAPVLPAAELGERVSFGPRQTLRLLAATIAVALAYLAVFHYQAPLLDLLGGAAHKRQPWLAPVLVTLAAPLIAWLYGIVAGSLLKILRFE